MNSITLPGPVASHPLISQWITLHTDGTIHIFSGRVELGQGITTALLQIAAEELDVGLTALRITQGDTRVCPAEGPTVGSLSIPLGGMSMRLAASAARHAVLSHAAGLLQTAPDQLTMEDGLILRNGTDTGLGYGALAADVDLACPIADYARPKAPEARRISGQPVPRTDLAARLLGGHLIHDMTLDGMLHGRIIQPPRLDATLASDPADVLGQLSPGTRLVRDGTFLGVVCAREEVAIRDAKKLGALVEWISPNTPEAPDPIDALDMGIVESEVLTKTGGGLVAGATTVTAKITKPVLNHASIGPSCAVARWDGGRLTVWAHSQNVYALRASLAAVLGVSIADVDVIFTPGSGCYGHNSADDVALDAALMARGCGQPVRVLWMREHELKHAPMNPAMKTELTATLDVDGRITAYQAIVTSPPHSTRPDGAKEPNLRASAFMENPIPMGPGNDAPQPQGGADRNATPGYVIPSVQVRRDRPAIVPYRPSAMRGLGAFVNVIALETLMENCAEAAGVESTAYRIAHLNDPRAIAVIKAVAAMADKPAKVPDGVGYGLGYARYKNSAGYLACIARVEVEDEVRVTDVWAAADVGEAINPDGTKNQIEGGILQAISWALKEQITFSGGSIQSASWDDYPILGFSEVPRMTINLITHPEAPALGAGEVSGGPAGAAVVNAVRHALGVAPDRLPLSRHALVTLLTGG